MDVGLWEKLSAEELMLLNCGVGEDSWESLGPQETQPVHPKENQSWIFIGRTDVEAENSNTLATWWEALTHLKRPWCWERLKVGGEGDNRGWDGWMASPTQWTWVRAISRSWWWTGKPGVLQSMGLQKVGHDWATELTDWKLSLPWSNDFSNYMIWTWKQSPLVQGVPNLVNHFTFSMSIIKIQDVYFWGISRFLLFSVGQKLFVMTL